MLTVWSLCWGDKYPDYYVQRLKQSVSDNLTLDHRFVCITDRDIEGVKCVPPPTDWPGWWGKIGLFKPGFCDEYNLWLDLDVVITGNLDQMVIRYSGLNFASANNWANSGHGGIQSSVMLWKGGKGCHAEWIYRFFDPAIAYWPPRNEPGVCLWGDQEWCTQLRDAGKLNHTPIDPELIQSYKYHVRPTHSVPDGCKIVVFHGDPKPSDVSESWFRW